MKFLATPLKYSPVLRALSPVYRQSARRWLSQPPGGRLQLLSARPCRPAVTFPTEELHRPSAVTKLCCLLTEAHACEQLADGWDSNLRRFVPRANALLLHHTGHITVTQLYYICYMPFSSWYVPHTRSQCTCYFSCYGHQNLNCSNFL